MRSLAWLPLFLLIAGCAGASGQSASMAPSSSQPTSQTAIDGKVINSELAPIVGALVAVDGLPPVLTDDKGAFHALVEPGAHKLIVQALGYTSVGRSVEAVFGQTVNVQFQLEALPIITPYTEVRIYDGYDICSWALIAEVGNNGSLLLPCPIGVAKNSFRLSFPAEWKYFVLEMSWTTQDSFWVSMNTAPGCTTGAPCPAVEIGPSPLRIEGAPANAALAARYALDGKKQWPEGGTPVTISNLYAGALQHELNSTIGPECSIFWGQFGVPPRLGCPLGVGFSTGIKFEEFVSVFHYEAPAKPSAYSARPK
jgi:hypothetical protein